MRYTSVRHGKHTLATAFLTAAALAFVGSIEGQLAGTQHRLTTTVGLGDSRYDAEKPAVAYNPIADEFLVVWQADDEIGSQVDDEYEIFARRIDGSTGTPLGQRVRVTHFGEQGNPAYKALDPDVIFNPARNQYYVVFRGVGPGGGEVYGQRLNGVTAQPTWVFRQLSDMGPPGDPFYGVGDPRVAYNPFAEEYMVVWWAEDDRDGHVENEREIYAQRVETLNGLPIGEDDRLISEMGPVGSVHFGARDPQIAYDDVSDRWVVIWRGDHDADGQIDGEEEVFLQTLDGETGAPLLPTQRRISMAGGALGEIGQISVPTLAFNPTYGEAVVVWRDRVDENARLVAQRIDPRFGIPIGVPDQVLIDSPSFSNYLDLAFSPSDASYRLAFAQLGGAHNDFDAWLLDLDSEALPTAQPLLVGDMQGPASGYDTESLAVAVHPINGRTLIVWSGDHEADGQLEDEYEIFYNFAPHQIFSDGFESGDVSAWSSLAP